MYFDEQLVFTDLKAKDKKSLLKELAGEFVKCGYIDSLDDDYYKNLMERENSFSTGIGKNVAIPHGKSDSVKELKVIVAIIPEGVEFDTLDDEPVKIIFMFATKPTHTVEYMKLLSRITMFLREDENRDKLLAQKNKQELLELVREIVYG